MRLQYLIGNLSDYQLQNVWAVLQHIKDTLDYSEPSTAISISLNPEDYCINISPVQIKTILEYLQRKEILRFLERHELDQNLNSLPVEVKREKFNVEFKSVENEIKSRNLAITKGFEEKKASQDELPKDLKWEEITLHFLNGHEAIIKARGASKHTNYEEMGFQDQKRNLPNKQWEFLKLLAEKNGELSWENANLPLGEMNKFKKQKQILSETLKAYFKIREDPFCDYKQEKSYKIKINLIPEAKGSNDTNEDSLGIKNHYKKQTPKIHDPRQ